MLKEYQFALTVFVCVLLPAFVFVYYFVYLIKLRSTRIEIEREIYYLDWDIEILDGDLNSNTHKNSKPKVKLIDRREVYYKRWAEYYGF